MSPEAWPLFKPNHQSISGGVENNETSRKTTFNFLTPRQSTAPHFAPVHFRLSELWTKQIASKFSTRCEEHECKWGNTCLALVAARGSQKLELCAGRFPGSRDEAMRFRRDFYDYLIVIQGVSEWDYRLKVTQNNARKFSCSGKQRFADGEEINCGTIDSMTAFQQ